MATISSVWRVAWPERSYNDTLTAWAADGIGAVVNFLGGVDTEEINDGQADVHYKICDTYRQRMAMGRDMECQTEEEWEEQLFNIKRAYAEEECDTGPKLTDLNRMAFDAVVESAVDLVTGDPDHWRVAWSSMKTCRLSSDRGSVRPILLSELTPETLPIWVLRERAAGCPI